MHVLKLRVINDAEKIEHQKWPEKGVEDKKDMICSYLLHGYGVPRLCIEEKGNAEFFCAVRE